MMLHLDPKKTALVLIDLQKGILAKPTQPYSSDDVLDKSKKLAQQFRHVGAPVILVHVGWNSDFSNAPKGIVDQESIQPEGGLPDNWLEFGEGLVHEGDRTIMKHQWGAFTGTSLDLQLRRLGVDTIAMAGIATNIGVESTVRQAWELNYSVVVVEDACTTFATDQHQMSVDVIFPRIARVIKAEQLSLLK